MRRCNLVHDQVERMVKGTDRHHRANRFMPGECQPPGRCCIQPHGDFLSGIGTQTVNAVAYTIDGTRHLDARVPQGFTTFLRGQPRQ